MSGRRLVVLVVLLAAIGIPAGILQALCVGGSCPAEPGESHVPFCPLPDALRTAIANGYREGRSADVLAVAGTTPIGTEVDGLRIAWPSIGSSTDERVPLVFEGAGIRRGAAVAEGATLDRVAPTVADALGFRRPFPEVRSGTALPGVPSSSRGSPRLVLLVAWKGIGSRELDERADRWPFLRSLLGHGAGTLDAETGSLPLDPTATLTTIGTGGLPFQHGITGSLIRNDRGRLVEAYDEHAPVTVIATLADDLDHADPRTLVGLALTNPHDRGLAGGGWYPDQEPIDVAIGPAANAPLTVATYLSAGYGADAVPDVIGVTLDGDIQRMDRLTRRIVTEAQRATDGATLVVVAGTGTRELERSAVTDAAAIDAVEEAIPGMTPGVEAAVPGGLFLDQQVLGAQQITGQVAAQALLDLGGSDGGRMMADAFQGFAVSFARYC